MKLGPWGFRSDAIRRLELAAQGSELEADTLATYDQRVHYAEIQITYKRRTIVQSCPH